MLFVQHFTVTRNKSKGSLFSYYGVATKKNNGIFQSGGPTKKASKYVFLHIICKGIIDGIFFAFDGM